MNEKLLGNQTMAIIKNIVFILITLFSLTSCFNTSWTPEQRKEFETKCNQTDTVHNLVCLFYGFHNNEFDSILIREYQDTTLLDSFKVFVWPAQSPSDIKRKERSATIRQGLNIKNNYHFIIPGQKPYVLANMKMIMWAQYTMAGEGWGCEMGDYTIDGVRFEHNSNPTFEKRYSK